VVAAAIPVWPDRMAVEIADLLATSADASNEETAAHYSGSSPSPLNGERAACRAVASERRVRGEAVRLISRLSCGLVSKSKTAMAGG